MNNERKQWTKKQRKRTFDQKAIKTITNNDQSNKKKNDIKFN
jgi:hypothetical protein